MEVHVETKNKTFVSVIKKSKEKWKIDCCICTFFDFTLLFNRARNGVKDMLVRAARAARLFVVALPWQSYL